MFFYVLYNEEFEDSQNVFTLKNILQRLTFLLENDSSKNSLMSIFNFLKFDLVESLIHKLDDRNKLESWQLSYKSSKKLLRVHLLYF